MFVSVLKFDTPSRNDKIYYTHFLENVIKELGDRAIPIREEVEHAANPNPIEVGKATHLKIEQGWLWAFCEFNYKHTKALVREGKRYVRPFMLAEFQADGTVIGISELRYFFLVRPYDASWPNERKSP